MKQTVLIKSIMLLPSLRPAANHILHFPTQIESNEILQLAIVFHFQHPLARHINWFISSLWWIFVFLHNFPPRPLPAIDSFSPLDTLCIFNFVLRKLKTSWKPPELRLLIKIEKFYRCAIHVEINASKSVLPIKTSVAVVAVYVDAKPWLPRQRVFPNEKV